MRIVAVSDLHGQLRTDLPEGDVLVIAGDICPDFISARGHRHGFIQENGEQRQSNWLRSEFSDWLEYLHPAYDAIIAIAGNHDYVFEHEFLLPQNLPWTYLKDQEAIVDGVKFYGSPWVPNLARWAFYATPTALQARAESIPRDTDVLISHGPPKFHRDWVGPSSKQQWKYDNSHGEHVGDIALNDALNTDLEPPVLICGHIHEQHGLQCHVNKKTKVYNVAQLDDFYDQVYKPVVIDL